MKKFFVFTAIFAAMFLTVSCGGGDGDDNDNYGNYDDNGNYDGNNNGNYDDNGNNGENNGGNYDDNNQCTEGQQRCSGSSIYICSNGHWNYLCEYKYQDCGVLRDAWECAEDDNTNDNGNNGNNNGGNNGGNDNNGEGDDDDCAEGLFYYQNECQTPWGKMWTVTFEEAQVSEKKADDTAWDVPGGLPDLFACLYINNEKKFCTSVVDDATKAVWDSSTTVEFSAKTDEILYCLFDEDLSEHDLVGCAEHKFEWFTYDGIEVSGGVVDHFWFTLTPAW